MTATGFALIGHSFSSDLYESLYRTSVATRRRERGGIWAAGRPLPAQNAWLTTRRSPVSMAPTR